MAEPYENPYNLPEEKEKYILVNAYEDIVSASVKELMQYIDMCRCEKCYKDACALVLNQLKPHYVTTKKGTMLSQMPKVTIKNYSELTIIVAKTLQVVKQSPQHD